MTDPFVLLDLAAMRLGGMALAASDEFFAPKERLLEPAAPVFEPGRYTDRGKWMDGWETRRRRGPGHDWCVVRLGVPGVVRGVLVDTAHFEGNHPQACSLDGLAAEGDLAAADPAAGDGWVELVARTELQPDAEHRLEVADPVRATHVRLRIYPDGGVARLRVHGEPLPDLRTLAGPPGRLDLAAATSGGEAVACSNMFFSSRHNLVMPGDAADMGEGWETRRRRGPGHDWAVVRLAAEAAVERVEVATTHFKGNYPESCEVEACSAPAAGRQEVPEAGWWTLVPRSPLRPHALHAFPVEADRPATHIRLIIHPDGGVSRLRVFGRVTDEGWRRWGVGWLDALPASRAEMDAVLGHNRYGKSGIRLVRVTRDERHELVDLTVDIALEGDFAATHLTGDNRAVLPTDTMRGTVYAFAGEGPVGEPEAFGLRLAGHFVDTVPAATKARVQLVQQPWARIEAAGGPHPHAFVGAGPGRRTATVTRAGGDAWVVAGLDDLLVLKTTGSAFEGFLKDRYTTLEETDGRILATVVTARWRYATLELDWAEAAAEVRMAMPNKHHLPVDLTPYGLSNTGAVFVATDRPYGLIEGTVTRDGAPPAGAAWA